MENFSESLEVGRMNDLAVVEKGGESCTPIMF